MTYKETIEFMYAKLPMFHREGKAAYKANLDNIKRLAKELGNPESNLKTIHVAGTNGKGSTSHMLASVLQHAGYKTGLFTSPHLIDFRERIKINGSMVPENEIVDFIEKNKHLIEEIEPSFFEMTTALAFDFFYRQKVDIAVIETGLGGRLDATNIIKPLISVITNISYDHTDILGETLDLIAVEKAGIIKKGVPVILGKIENNIHYVFENKASELGSKLVDSSNLFKSIEIPKQSQLKQQISIMNIETLAEVDYELDLLGNYQAMNLQTVLASISELRLLDIKIDKTAEYSGLANAAQTTGLMGRWQVLGQSPLIIADTGHNEDGLKQTMQQLEIVSHQNVHIVLGFVKEKSIEKILPLFPKEATYYFTKANIPRALDEKQLAEMALKSGLRGNSFGTVKSALYAAKMAANTKDVIYIGGSTFIVAEALII